MLTGSADAEVLIGGGGNDLLDGAGGNDVLKGGSGDDVLIFDAADTRAVEGDHGRDTLRLTGANTNLDLSLLDDRLYRSIERIELTGSGDNTLALDARDVLAMVDHVNEFTAGSTRQLLVDGDTGDGVTLLGNGWSQGLDVDLGGTQYVSFTHATLPAQLLLHPDLSIVT
jgi:Ca2+-binding RTX toxin-like protein